ncbi:hypothetical protein [Bythopirellula polymerisocia]|uniref:Uncharacterized protein n=1 Tax=Bythopirellula polymerisocia TaxID=2528003 RepID=A0A5C6CTU0_9BACT|nr:hypothetical protein [Bythopirellula polymerisocia]TWU27818.1 hypothetical protein Pla144_25950 [Bythopirellula polymerisocia]
MLRFTSVPSTNRSRLLSKAGWRVWLLVGLLGIVIVSMQALEQPTTVERIDSLFRPVASSDDRPTMPTGPILAIAAGDSPQESAPRNAPSVKSKSTESSVDFSDIEDNTYFRSEENEAWFAILDGLCKKSSQQIRSQSVGELTYAQLISQPNVYRGKVVTMAGRVLREETLDAPANDFDINSYHRLVIRPAGGGVWPIIVYSLELPESFPRGDSLNVEVLVQGVFFKNWSYAWEEGLGLAPVLLAKTVDTAPGSSDKKAGYDSRESTVQRPSKTVVEEKGSFRDVLELIGLGPAVLQTISAKADLTDADWHILAPLFARLTQHKAADLARWTLPAADLASASVGDLFKVSGTALECESIPIPVEFAPLLGVSEIYRCRLQAKNSQSVTLFTPEIPKSWLGKSKMLEPVVCRAVLLRDIDQSKIMATNRLSWFPESGVGSGKLLLSQHGMDASLWDAVAQRGEFASPESSREAEAFFSALAALDAVAADQLSAQVSAHFDCLAKTPPVADEITEKKIAATIAEQAQHGLSSVVPLFLAPEGQVGELVRLEGIARRAVRIVEQAELEDGNLNERFDYYELELFTRDSQNLPVIGCVTQLPAGFPLGDEIREQVRLEGVFFKSWRYRSRKLVDSNGETSRQQQRYTPVVLAGNVTWIQSVSDRSSWWGPIAGIGFLIILAVAWASFFAHWRNDRSPRAKDDLIDLPNL